MNAHALGLYARLLGDVRSSTILAGSTTSVLKVADPASWRPSSMVYTTGAGASAANAWWVSVVKKVTVATGELELALPLPAVPVGGANLVKCGVRDWLRYTSADESALEWVKDPRNIEAERIANAEEDPRVVGRYGEIGQGEEARLFDLAGRRFEVRFAGLALPFVLGAMSRAEWLLDADQEDFAAPGLEMHSTKVETTGPVARGDAFYEQRLVVFLEAIPAEVG